MTHSNDVSLLYQLAHISTPIICNALELLQYRLRNEGYIDSKITLRTPLPYAVAGYAVTLQVRTAKTPVKGKSYKDTNDWWNSILSMPSPRVLIINDVDNPPGTGSTMGIIHAEIFKALGCVGVITNGAIRDLQPLAHTGLHIFSSSVCPSHAYAHITGVNQPVTLFGVTFNPGDIVHGDINGITTLPKDTIKEVIERSMKIIEHEHEIIRFCKSNDFDLPALKKLLNKME